MFWKPKRFLAVVMESGYAGSAFDGPYTIAVQRCRVESLDKLTRVGPRLLVAVPKRVHSIHHLCGDMIVVERIDGNYVVA